MEASGLSESTTLFELKPAEFDSLRDLVLACTGISLAESKLELVKRRFSPRLKALGLATFTAYISYVENNYDSESSHFCNAITTNLTSFYRENHHFDLLKEQAFPEIIPKLRSGQRLRIWSAGCSTGQEAYCMAITLLQCIPDAHKKDIRILATDLDENCLETARQGVYQVSEFSKVPKTVLNDHFTTTQQRIKNLTRDAYVASDKLKTLITFKKLNLMHKWPMKGPFDIIFCRNVFIYFDKDTQQQLLKGFADMQKPGSYLCLGHSETVANPAAIGYKLIGKTSYQRV